MRKQLQLLKKSGCRKLPQRSVWLTQPHVHCSLIWNRGAVSPATPVPDRSISSKKEARQVVLPKESISSTVVLPKESISSTARRHLTGAEFSAYDETGLPTHDKDGTALPKSAVKKLSKASFLAGCAWCAFVACALRLPGSCSCQQDLEKQKKLHESWKASQKS